MALTKNDVPNILKDALKTLFMVTLRKAPDESWRRIASVVPSGDGRDGENYAWLGQVPGVREWLDERVVKAFQDYGYQIKNKKWESTIEVMRETIDAEQYGQIRLRIMGMAESHARHKAKLVWGLVSAGATSVAYDSKYFFDTTHAEGESGTQINKGTTAFSSSALQAVISAMRVFKDDRGELLGVTPDLLVVPPGLEWTAKETLQSVVIPVRVGDGTAGSGATASTSFTNVLMGALDLLVVPYLTDVNDWFVFDTTKAIKPLVLQQSDALEFDSLDNPGVNSEAFMRDRYLYGTRERYNAGYGLWQLAYGQIVTNP